MFCDEVATMSSSLRIELISGIVIAIGISNQVLNILVVAVPDRRHASSKFPHCACLFAKFQCDQIGSHRWNSWRCLFFVELHVLLKFRESRK
jgi:hypothetical protein